MLAKTNQAGRIVVVWAQVTPVAAGDALADLDEVERARVARLRRAGDRDRYVSAHRLLRREAGAWLGVPADQVRFDRTCARCGRQHGRPVVLPPGPGMAGGCPAPAVPSVSLTHSGGLAGVALRSGPGLVGLDAEEPWPPDGRAGLADMVLAPGDDASVPVRRVWVAKEAVLKAAGVGLREPMTGFALRPGPGQEATSRARVRAREWWVRPVPAPPGYAAAVAGDGEAPAQIQVRGA